MFFEMRPLIPAPWCPPFEVFGWPMVNNYSRAKNAKNAKFGNFISLTLRSLRRETIRLIFPRILTYHYVDDRGAVLFQRAFERWLDAVRMLHSLTEDAEGFR